jgi:threonine synthase
MSAYAALAGLPAHVFMPADVPATFRAECKALGAGVTLVDGLIDDCGVKVRAGAAQHGWFELSTLREPYRIEGKKTMGYELAEQLGWTLPDVIVYPTGGGTGLIGMWKAFDELEAIGLIGPARPRMVSVQSDGCAPIARAFQDGLDRAQPWHGARTIADGLRVPSAIGDFLILRALRKRRRGAGGQRRRDDRGRQPHGRDDGNIPGARGRSMPGGAAAPARQRLDRAGGDGGAVQHRQRIEVRASVGLIQLYWRSCAPPATCLRKGSTNWEALGPMHPVAKLPNPQ